MPSRIPTPRSEHTPVALPACDTPVPSSASRLDIELPTQKPAPWPGRSVIFHHRPDGTVSATSRGLVAIGKDEADALRRLESMLTDEAGG